MKLTGANNQGETLEKARETLRKAVNLVLEANRELAEKSLAGTKLPGTIGTRRRMKRIDLVRHRDLHSRYPSDQRSHDQ